MYLILHVLCVVGLSVGHTMYAQDAQKTAPVAVDVAEQVPKEVAPSKPDLSTQDQVPTTGQRPAEAEIPAIVSGQSQTASQQSTLPVSAQQSGSDVPVVPQTPQAPSPIKSTDNQQEQSAQPTQAHASVAKPEIEEIKGINTVDLDEPRGNWLFKRIWWERAEQKYEKIRQLVEKLVDSRMAFYEKRSQVDKQVLEFYHDIGLDQGALQATVDQLILQLHKEREKDGSLSLEDREMLQKLTENKKAIEQLQTYVEMVRKLDHEMDSSLHKLLEQMNAIRGYEADAWKNFKEIARVLSDTKARELWYGMEVALSNIQEVQEYLQEPFREHVDHIASMMTTHIQFIKDAVHKLKEQGIDLVAQVENKESQPAVTTQEPDQEHELEEPQGWISWTVSSIKTGFGVMWDYLVSTITWPYRKLFGSAQNDEPEHEEYESGDQSEPSGDVQSESDEQRATSGE